MESNDQKKSVGSKQESLLESLPKLVLFVSIIVCVGTIAGTLGYFLTRDRALPPVTVPPDPVASDDVRPSYDTSIWQTYSNLKYHYSLKYPQGWRVDSDSEQVITLKEIDSNDSIIVGKGDGSPDTSLEDNITWLKEKLDKPNFSLREITQIRIPGARVFLDESNPDFGKQYYIVTKSETLAIVYHYYEYSSQTKIEKDKFLLEGILPTFSFEKEATYDPSNLMPQIWSVYGNGNYDYEFEYPAVYDKDMDFEKCRVTDYGDGKFVAVANRIWVQVSDAGGIDLQEYINNRIKDLKVESKTPVTIAGQQTIRYAYRLSGSNAWGEMVFIEKSGNIFTFSLERPNNECDYNPQNISIFGVYENILSTFKFMDQKSKNDLSLENMILSHGVPEKYGSKLGVSFDRAQESVNIFKIYDMAYGNKAFKLGDKEMKRYINIGQRISCEFCCSAKALIDNEGKPACACAHSGAMRGLAVYLLINYGSEYTDDEILHELARWKAVYFPQKMMLKVINETTSGGYSQDTAALVMDIDKRMLKEAVKNYPADRIKTFPDQNGGC